MVFLASNVVPSSLVDFLSPPPLPPCVFHYRWGGGWIRGGNYPVSLTPSSLSLSLSLSPPPPPAVNYRDSKAVRSLAPYHQHHPEAQAPNQTTFAFAHLLRRGIHLNCFINFGDNKVSIFLTNFDGNSSHYLTFVETRAAVFTPDWIGGVSDQA